MYAHDPILIEGSAQASLPVTTSGAHTAGLSAGIYDVWADADCWLKVAETTASNVTVSTGYLLRAGNTVAIKIDHNRRIGAVVASGTTTLYYHRVAP